MNPSSGFAYRSGSRLMSWLCRHRRSWPVRILGRSAYYFYRGYENRNFDFQSNGEEWCLRQLAGADMRCAFDVGANVGDWTALALQVWPETAVHAFEIVPANFEQLERNVGASGRVRLNPVGLSDTEAEIEVHFSRTTHFRASAYAMPDVPDTILVKARVVRGDDYARQRALEQIDYLKIDVEGMEGAVLRGFREMLRQKRVRVIQFEYNTTNIVSGFLLRNAYELLAPMGYSIGKLYPNYVDFRPYELAHEDFCGPNFIAVRSEDQGLFRMLT